MVNEIIDFLFHKKYFNTYLRNNNVEICRTHGVDTGIFNEQERSGFEK